MSILENTFGKQQFTLQVIHSGSNERVICTYNDEPICTTNLDSLIQYARTLVLNFGTSRTYSISRIAICGEIELAGSYNLAITDEYKAQLLKGPIDISGTFEVENLESSDS